MRSFVTTLGLVAICALPCHASVLLEAEMFGKTLQYTDKGGVSGCGVDVTAFERRVIDLQGAHVFQAAFVVSGVFNEPVKKGAVFVGRAGIMDPHRLLTNDSEAFRANRAQRLWAKPSGSPGTAPLDGTSPDFDDDSGFLSYVTSPMPVTSLLSAVQSGKPIQLGGYSDDVVLVGVVEMSSIQSQQLAECILEYGKRAK